MAPRRTCCLLPTVIAIVAILGYPIVNLVELSLQQYGLFQLITHHGIYIGLANFASVLSDPVFWNTLLRTVVLHGRERRADDGDRNADRAAARARLDAGCGCLLTAALVLVWSMPPVVAVQVWSWMTNLQNGVLNYALTQLHIGNYFQHNWYSSTLSQYGMVTTLIVWGALPFVAITRLCRPLAGAARARRGGSDRRRAAPGASSGT